MEVSELRDACEEAIARHDRAEIPSDFPFISLVIPRFPKGDKMRLCGKSGPLCEWICNSQEGKGTVAVWNARKVLKYLLEQPK